MPFNQGKPVQVSVVNHSLIPVDQWLPAGKTLSDLCSVLDKYIADVATYWGGAPLTHVVSDHILDANWGMCIYDDSDQAGALGYHDLTPDGLPLGKVFVRDTLQAGDEVTVDISHESAEWFVDPACNLCFMDQHGWFWFGEVADAVEETYYEIDGIKVSNFVFPSFFETFRRPDTDQFDKLGLVNRPLELLKGGYMSVNRGRGGWKQVYGSMEAMMKNQNRFRNRRMILNRRQMLVE